MPESFSSQFPNMRDRRAELRSQQTAAEEALWKVLRGRILGRKFRRQQQLGPYIVNFYCGFAALVVEVDGAHHFTSDGVEYDEERTAYLTGRGLRVLRFTNGEVLRNLDAVIAAIRDALALTPGPSPERGEE
jgi:very-short-patch-repair endonuclease